MKNSKNKKTSGNKSKKKARKQIEKKLETALSNLQPILGKKRFKRRIKKAGKVIAGGIKNFNSNGSNGAVKTEKEKTSVSPELKNENV